MKHMKILSLGLILILGSGNRGAIVEPAAETRAS